MLAVPRTREQPVDDALIGAGRGVGEKGLHLGGRGRQPREVEGDAADQRGPVRFGGRGQIFPDEPRADEGVDGIRRRRGHGGTPGREKRPVRLVNRALGDPAPQQRDFLGLEGLVRLGRRHPFLFFF